jgi:hypothetical protein
MTTITPDNSFNTDCDFVDYSTAHILSWLRRYAKSQKVAGSITDGVIGLFQLM